MKIELLGASVLLVLAPDLARSQQPTSSSFVFPSGMGNTGVFRIPVEEGELQVQVELVAEGGARSSALRCDPVWTVRDPSVLALLRSDAHYSAWVKPVKEGITELRAAFSCAPKLDLSVPVVVGAGAMGRPFAASGEARNLYPARLTVQPAGSLSIDGGRAVLGTDDKGVQFVASVHNADGGLINANEFPVKWRVSNPRVLAIEKAYDHTVFFNAVEAGTSTVTADVEGTADAAGKPGSANCHLQGCLDTGSFANGAECLMLGASNISDPRLKGQLGLPSFVGFTW